MTKRTRRWTQAMLLCSACGFAAAAQALPADEPVQGTATTVDAAQQAAEPPTTFGHASFNPFAAPTRSEPVRVAASHSGGGEAGLGLSAVVGLAALWALWRLLRRLVD